MKLIIEAVEQIMKPTIEAEETTIDLMKFTMEVVKVAA
jgi:hypothetical protein